MKLRLTMIAAGVRRRVFENIGQAACFLFLTAIFGFWTAQAQFKNSDLTMRTVRDNSIVAVEPIYVSSFFDSAIYRFDASTGTLLQTVVAPYSTSTLSGPQGLTFGPDGNLYISSQFNNSIVKYTFATSTLSTFIPSSVLQPIASSNGLASFAPAGLRFGPDGNLYVSMNGGQSALSGGAIVRFNISNIGGVLSYAGTSLFVATGLVQPTGITFGPPPTDTANLYVSNSAVGNVIKVTGVTSASPTAAQFVSAGAGGLNYPSGLVWGPDGNLHVVDQGATSNVGQVLKFASNGSFTSVFNQPANSLLFQFPSDGLFTNTGQFLTANLGPAFPPNLQGSISLFNADGTFAQTLVSSAQFPNTGPGTSGFSPSQIAKPLAPSAANIAIGGRVLTETGSGISGAIVTMSTQDGEIRTARTSSFGYYRFDNVTTGQIVTLSVSSKRYQFTPQVIGVSEELSQVNFVAAF